MAYASDTCTCGHPHAIEPAMWSSSDGLPYDGGCIEPKCNCTEFEDPAVIEPEDDNFQRTYEQCLRQHGRAGANLFTGIYLGERRDV